MEMIQVSREFIEEALWNEIEKAQRARPSEIRERASEAFVSNRAYGEIVGTAQSVVDNWRVNGERETYEGIRDRIGDGSEYNRDEHSKEVEEWCRWNGWFYDGDLEEAVEL